MRRRDVIALLASTAPWPFAALAQQAGKIYRIGYLGQTSQNDVLGGADLATLITNLRDLGYVAGQNLVVLSRYAEGRIDNLPALARELVDANPQVIVVPTAGVAEVVLQQTKTLPFGARAAGLLHHFRDECSLAKPGVNTPGMKLY